MAFKKIDKEFQYTDDTLNVYGFRMLTSGYLINEFKKNPIGYHNHADPDLTTHTREEGVLVRWEDFRIDGDKVFAKPVVNLSHPRGQQTCDEIEEGFLNGASIGKIVALEYSDDPAFWLPGQCGPTLTKWYHKELSLVDIPGNINSLSLFDKDGKAINLADFKTSQNQNLNMKQIFLTPELIGLLSLSDSADQNAVQTAIKDLSDKAKKVDAMQLQLDAALADKTTAENNLANIEKQSKESKVKAILETALADKKLTKASADALAIQFEGKPDELKSLVDTFPAYQSITEQIKGESTEQEKKFQSLSYSQLDKEGLLPALKASNLDLFKQKFKEEYKTEYKS